MPTGYYTRKKLPDVMIECQHCHREFPVRPQALQKRAYKFCSKDCYAGSMRGAYKTSQKECSCLECGKIFAMSKRRVEKYGVGKFCSKRCMTSHRTGVVVDGEKVTAKWKSPEEIKKYHREYARKNKESVNARAREARQNNPDTYKKIKTRWRESNRDSIKAAFANKRTADTGAGGRMTGEEWGDLKKEYNYSCVRCLRSEPEIKLCVDHVKAISKGGDSNIKNIQPLCYSCNSKKNNREIDYRASFANRSYSSTDTNR